MFVLSPFGLQEITELGIVASKKYKVKRNIQEVAKWRTLLKMKGKSDGYSFES